MNPAQAQSHTKHGFRILKGMPSMWLPLILCIGASLSLNLNLAQRLGVDASSVTRKRTSGGKLEENCAVDEDGSMQCASDSNSSTSNDEWGFVTDGCTDEHELCSFWSTEGECKSNPNYMLEHCAKSCNSCDVQKRKQQNKNKLKSQSNNINIENIKDQKEFLIKGISKYGTPQRAEGNDESKTLLNILQTLSYMNNFVHNPKPTHKMSRKTVESCTNKEALCSYWAVLGECDVNPSYMVTNCAPACRTCHKIDINERCGLRDPATKSGLQKPGSLNAMFERIVSTAPGNQTDESAIAAERGDLMEPDADGDQTPVYTVTIHSHPQSSRHLPQNRQDDGDSDGEPKLIADKKKDRAEDPWVITFDNFLSDEECDHLIQLGYTNGYERSKDVGPEKFDGSFDGVESKTRTSANAWCDTKSGCRTDPIVQRILKRLSKVTEIDTVNYEDFQILKYEEGQFYRTHHDFIEHQRDRLCGPRILTFFLYLSDVEEDGGTGFPDLDIVVNPKKGRALLWPSIMNYDPLAKDMRFRHEAIAVKKGTKFAANAWIHQYDYINAHNKGCA